MKPSEIYDVLKRPLITEKATRASETNTYCFIVDGCYSKNQIKEVVSNIFDVDVISVNTLILKGKIKRFKGKLGQRKTIKKAFVKVKDGQNLDMSIGI
jgi:large subunit ribosomal protein L23